jgi:hypothetical protein
MASSSATSQEEEIKQEEAAEMKPAYETDRVAVNSIDRTLSETLKKVSGCIFLSFPLLKFFIQLVASVAVDL